MIEMYIFCIFLDSMEFCIFLESMEFCILWDKNGNWRFVCHIGFGLCFILIQLLDKWSWEVLIEAYYITQAGMLVMKGMICVPNVDDLRKTIMEEALLEENAGLHYIGMK